MTPDLFDSFAFGFNLDSAGYSGGAGGTFANMVAGGEDWAVSAATPTFSTQGGIEGMDFTASADESIIGEHRAMWESTIIAVGYPGSGATGHFYGGNYASGNTFALMVNAHRGQAYYPAESSGYTATPSPTGIPHVYSVTFSPENKTAYAQLDDATPVQAASDGFASFHEAAIGRHRTTYFVGWIGRILVFDRALHFRDNANLQLLITAEMARVGL